MSDVRRSFAQRRFSQPERWYGSGLGDLEPEDVLRAGESQQRSGDEPNELARTARDIAQGLTRRERDQAQQFEELSNLPGPLTRRPAGERPQRTSPLGRAAGGVGEFLQSIPGRITGAGREAADLVVEEAREGLARPLPEAAERVLQAEPLLGAPAVAGARHAQEQRARRGDPTTIEGQAQILDPDDVLTLGDVLGEGLRQFSDGEEYADGQIRHLTGSRYGILDIPGYERSPRVVREFTRALSPLTVASAGAGVGARAAVPALRAAAATSQSRSASLAMRGAANIIEAPTGSYGQLLSRELAADIAAQEFGYQAAERGAPAAIAIAGSFVAGGAAFAGPELARGAVAGYRGVREIHGRAMRDALEDDMGRPFHEMSAYIDRLAVGDSTPIDQQDIAEAQQVIAQLERSGGWVIDRSDRSLAELDDELFEWIAPDGTLVYYDVRQFGPEVARGERGGEVDFQGRSPADYILEDAYGIKLEEPRLFHATGGQTTISRSGRTPTFWWGQIRPGAEGITFAHTRREGIERSIGGELKELPVDLGDVEALPSLREYETSHYWNPLYVTRSLVEGGHLDEAVARNIETTHTQAGLQEFQSVAADVWHNAARAGREIGIEYVDQYQRTLDAGNADEFLDRVSTMRSPRAREAANDLERRIKRSLDDIGKYREALAEEHPGPIDVMVETPDDPDELWRGRIAQEVEQIGGLLPRLRDELVVANLREGGMAELGQTIPAFRFREYDAPAAADNIQPYDVIELDDQLRENPTDPWVGGFRLADDDPQRAAFEEFQGTEGYAAYAEARQNRELAVRARDKADQEAVDASIAAEDARGRRGEVDAEDDLARINDEIERLELAESDAAQRAMDAELAFQNADSGLYAAEGGVRVDWEQFVENRPAADPGYAIGILDRSLVQRQAQDLLRRAEASMLRQGWARVVGNDVRVWNVDRNLTDAIASNAVDALFAKQPDRTLVLRMAGRGSIRAFTAQDWLDAGMTTRGIAQRYDLSPPIAGGTFDEPVEPLDVDRFTSGASVGQAGFDASGETFVDDLRMTEREFAEAGGEEQADLDLLDTLPEGPLPGQAGLFGEQVPDELSPGSPSAARTEGAAAPEDVQPDVVPRYPIPEDWYRQGDQPFLPVASIVEDPERFQFRAPEDFDDRVRDIAEDFDPGRFNPVEVWREPDTGEHFLIAGHARLEALRRLGQENVPVAVREGSEADAQTLAALSNYHDRATTFLGDSGAFRFLSSQGMSESEIAQRVDRSQTFVRNTLLASRLGPAAAAVIDNRVGGWRGIAAEYGALADAVPAGADFDYSSFFEQATGHFLSLAARSLETDITPSRGSVKASLDIARELVESQPELFGAQQAGSLLGERVNIFGTAAEVALLRQQLRTERGRLVKRQGAVEQAGVEGTEVVEQMLRPLRDNITLLERRIENAEAEVADRLLREAAAWRAGDDIGDGSDDAIERALEADPIDTSPPEPATPEEAAATASGLPPAAAREPVPEALVPPGQPIETPRLPLPVESDTPLVQAPRPSLERARDAAQGLRDRVGLGEPEPDVDALWREFAAGDQGQPPRPPRPPAGQGALFGGEESLGAVLPPRVMDVLRDTLGRLGAPPGTPIFGNPYRLIDATELTDAWRRGRRDFRGPGLIPYRPDPGRIQIAEPLRTLQARTGHARMINRILVRAGESLLPEGVGVRDPDSGILVIDPKQHPEIEQLWRALDQQADVRAGRVQVPEGYEDAYAFALLMRDWENDFHNAFAASDGGVGVIPDYWARIYDREYLDEVGSVATAPGGPSQQFQTARFRRPRSDMSMEEVLGTTFTDDDGRRYMLRLRTYNPFESAAIRSEAGWDDRVQRATLAALEALGEAKPRGTAAPNGKRPPDIGYLWRDWLVDDAIATKLEYAFGPKPGHALWRGSHRLFQSAKRSILSFSLFQHIDIGSRGQGFGTVAGTLEQARTGSVDPKTLPRGLAAAARSVRAQFDPTERRNTELMINSATPQNPRGDISFADVFGSGGASIGDPSLRADAHLRDVAGRWHTDALDEIERLDEAGVFIPSEEVSTAEPGAVRAALGVTKQQTIDRVNQAKTAFEAGLFEQLYPITAMHILRSQILPAVDRLYPDLPASQRAAEAAGMLNRQMGTVGDWDSVIRDRVIRDVADMIPFSRSETESQFALVLGAVQGQNAGYWARNMTGFFLFTAGMANVIHFLSTGEPLPLERNIPLEYNPGRGILGVQYRGGYGGFAQPDVPIRVRSGERASVDLVGQMDTFLRVLDGPQDFVRGRFGVIPGLLYDQMQGADFYGNPLDTPQRRVFHAAQGLTPIPVQAGVQIAGALGQGGGIIPEGEVTLGARALGLQAVGPNLSAPGAGELRDRYPEGERPDRIEQELADRDELNASRGSVYAQRRIDRERINTEYHADLGALASQVQGGGMTQAQFRDALTEANKERAIKMAGLDIGYERHLSERTPPDDPNEAALYAYYDVYRELNEQPGLFDFREADRRIEALRGTWSTAQRAYVDNHLGQRAEDPTLPEEARYVYRTRDSLDATGFWELRGQAWSLTRMVFGGSNDPLAQSMRQFESFYEWRASIESEIVAEFTNSGEPPGIAQALARRIMDSTPVSQAFSDAHSELRRGWIEAHPGLADAAIDNGYLTGVGTRDLLGIGAQLASGR